jgi:hypothetical protein
MESREAHQRCVQSHPNGMFALAAYAEAISRISMKRTESPRVLFDQIATIKVKYYHFSSTDAELLPHIINALPIEYYIIIALADRDLKKDGKPIPLAELERDLVAHHRRLYLDNKAVRVTEKDESELTFSAQVSGGNRKAAVQ